MNFSPIRKGATSVAILVICLGAAGCDSVAEPGREAPRRLGYDADDHEITRDVRAALGADQDFRLKGVGVITRDGEVQLSGFLDSHAQIDRSLALAFGVPGVKGVANQLQLLPPGTLAQGRAPLRAAGEAAR